jgi:hypothetical protein
MNFEQLELFENWRPVAGYEGLYIVSDWGRLMSLPGKSKAGGFRQLDKTKFGYFRVKLRKNDKNMTFMVHRLVAAAFIGPCPPNKEIDHIDGNRTNNTLPNLRYLTSSENQKAAITRNRRVYSGEKNAFAKLTWAKVNEIRRLSIEGMTQQKIADLFNVRQTNISQIVNGKAWKTNKGSEKRGSN